MDGQRFCLRWDGFRESVSTLLDDLRADGELLDVTLCCDGSQVRAHRLVLAMCSPYFRQVLKTHPCDKLVLFLRDTPAADLSALVEFMYRGAVDVRQSQLASFIKTAEMLQIRGLSGDDDKSSPATPASPAPASSPASKRRRTTPDPGGSAAGSGFGPIAGTGSGSGQRHNSLSDSAGRSPVRTTATPPRVSQSSRTDSSDYSRDYARPAATTSQHVKSEHDNNYATPEYGQPDQLGQRDDSVDWSIDDVTGSAQRQPKQEPIDLTEDDDVDAALGCVAAIEAGYDTAGPPPPPLTRGSATGTAPQRFNLQGNAAPVSSPRLTSAPMASPAGWDVSGTGKGSTPAIGGTSRVGGDRSWSPAGGGGCGLFKCGDCDKVYRSAISLNNHTKQHLGLTVCPLCSKVTATVPTLRIHLRRVHRLAPAEIYMLIPQRPGGRPYTRYPEDPDLTRCVEADAFKIVVGQEYSLSAADVDDDFSTARNAFDTDGDIFITAGDAFDTDGDATALAGDDTVSGVAAGDDAVSEDAGVITEDAGAAMEDANDTNEDAEDAGAAPATSDAVASGAASTGPRRRKRRGRLTKGQPRRSLRHKRNVNGNVSEM